MTPAEEPLPPPQTGHRSGWATGGGASLLSPSPSTASFGLAPQFEEVYAEIHAPVPGPTGALLGLSHGLRACVVPGGLLLFIYPWWFGRRPAGGTGRATRTLSGFLQIALWFWAAWALFEPIVGRAGPLPK